MDVQGRRGRLRRAQAGVSRPGGVKIVRKECGASAVRRVAQGEGEDGRLDGDEAGRGQECSYRASGIQSSAQSRATVSPSARWTECSRSLPIRTCPPVGIFPGFPGPDPRKSVSRPIFIPTWYCILVKPTKMYHVRLPHPAGRCRGGRKPVFTGCFRSGTRLPPLTTLVRPAERPKKSFHIVNSRGPAKMAGFPGLAWVEGRFPPRIST